MNSVKASPYLASAIAAAPTRRAQVSAGPTTTKNPPKPTGSAAGSRKRKRADSAASSDTVTIVKKKKVTGSKSKEPRKKAQPLPLSISYETASEADRMLYDEKNNNVDFGTIRTKFNNMTGRRFTKSNISQRYAKLKTKFEGVQLSNKEQKQILDAQKEVVRKFETTDKWDQIAAIVAEKGGKTYTGKAVKKLIQEIKPERLNKAQASNVADDENSSVEDVTTSFKDVKAVGNTTSLDDTVDPSDVFGTDHMVEDVGMGMDEDQGSVGDDEDAEGEEDDMIDPVSVV